MPIERSFGRNITIWKGEIKTKSFFSGGVAATNVYEAPTVNCLPKVPSGAVESTHQNRSAPAGRVNRAVRSAIPQIPAMLSEASEERLPATVRPKWRIDH